MTSHGFETGWRIPGYAELQELGAGAQGRVVLARQVASGDVVAIKYLAAELLGNAQARATFRGEAEMLSRLADPHVARLRGFTETADGAAIIMEAVHGQSLRRLLDERVALAPEAALTVLKGSLLGLAAAHSVGVVHRDYKPTNVMVQDNGQSKLIDFGVAVLAGQGSIVGTPAYMSPEQWQGAPATAATDIYAATCVFFECVVGGRPFQAGTTEAWQAEHTFGTVPLDVLPEPLRPLVLRGMAKDPGQRFQNASEFVHRLEAIATAAYGSDWEQRGWYALGTAVALFTAAFPLTLLGGGAVGGGAVSGGAVATGTTAANAANTVAGTTAAQTTTGAGHAAGGSGVIGKVGGVKGVAGAGTAVTGAIVIAMVLWPSGPTVGGESRGSIRAYFTNPGVLLNQPNMPASESPYMKLDITVSPGRVKPGTQVHVTTRFQARTPQGVKYLPGGTRQCFGEKARRRDLNSGYNYSLGQSPTAVKEGQGQVWFYRTAKSGSARQPNRTGTFVTTTSKTTGESQPYVPGECAFISSWTDTRSFKMPGTDELPPGHYLISPADPPRLMEAERDNTKISLASVGPRTDVSLPKIRVFWD
ncbi:serine/threonine-protein kinase [Actinomadura rudentiformis]|uniref:Serine/threonine protein kinase n=1 Tax=Actinomadura rudentiformis TaxID=359158 RepID=A0A6H9Y8N0_9ACTN|nr:serine/threonine-protein kinase [Actinomadura rudentiformis]KAB2341286.1 serine/threonine protein kinase [Actinomadura rudentiformis]